MTLSHQVSKALCVLPTLLVAVAPSECSFSKMKHVKH